MRSRLLTLSVAAGLLFTGIGAAVAQSKDDWVLGRYKGGDYWYPGVVESVAGSKIKVVYDDGDRETLDVANVRPYDWQIGSTVECNFKNAGTWYPGKITALGGEKLSIAYDDGDRETTKTGRCRSN